MKVAILGYGEQGRSAYDYWNTPENEITVCDKKDSVELPNGVKKELGPTYLESLDEFDILVRSPSVHPNDILANNSPGIKGKITSVTNEFFRVCPTKNIVGVTGTKGKGTTSTLIAKILEASGKRVHIGGNIGTPPLDLLKDNIAPEDWVVLELANFQLIDLQFSPKFGVCLMVVPEHLDWHADFEEYVLSKQQLFVNQKVDDLAIYYGEDEESKKIVSISPGRKIPYYIEPGAIIKESHIEIDDQVICETGQLQLLGKHNWQNVCAAVTCTWQIDKNVDAIKSVLTTFKGLEHRLELVRELNGIKYYDDSFATNPESAIVAIEAFDEPKVVILGGSDKGATYEKLAQVISLNNVRGAVVIGDTAPAISDALRKAGYDKIVEGGSTIHNIVQAAKNLAKPGDVVLLSNGCASFGLFKNYKDRGEQFKKAVLALDSTA